MPDFLDTAELARRWHKSPGSLRNDRHRGTGPRYLKLGGRVLYALSDVYEFERASRVR